MGLFDSYFDPEQFQDSGGLLGRLLSLQGQQDQYQPGAGFDPQSLANGQKGFPPQSSLAFPTARPAVSNAMPAPESSQTPDETQDIAARDYQMPQFGGADVPLSAAPAPDLSDRLNAGFQSWAHTPVGNPFAAIANGITGFSSGQRTDASQAAPTQASPQALRAIARSRRSPQCRLSKLGAHAGWQSLCRIGQWHCWPELGTARPSLTNAQQDINTRYEALRPVLGDRNAMLAIVHPEAGQTLMAQALARQQNAGNTDSARQWTAGWQQPSQYRRRGPADRLCSTCSGKRRPCRRSRGFPT